MKKALIAGAALLALVVAAANPLIAAGWWHP